MSLVEAVNELGTDKNPAELLTLLNETVEISRDDTSYMWNGVNRKLVELNCPIEVIMTWSDTIVTVAGGQMLCNMLSSDGVNFSSDIIQSLLASAKVGANGPVTNLLTMLQQVGVRTGPRWRSMGCSEQPTESTIQAAIDRCLVNRWVANVINDVIHPAVAEGKSIAQIKSLVASS